MKSRRSVFDTNIVLSALLFATGRLAWLRAEWRQDRLKPLVSRETVTELLRVLAYPKFRLTATEREELLADYLPFCETVVVSDPPPAVPECRDPCDVPFLHLALAGGAHYPGDVPFLHLALAGGAHYLITGDRDLLALGERFVVPIVTVERLRAILG